MTMSGRAGLDRVGMDTIRKSLQHWEIGGHSIEYDEPGHSRTVIINANTHQQSCKKNAQPSFSHPPLLSLTFTTSVHFPHNFLSLLQLPLSPFFLTTPLPPTPKMKPVVGGKWRQMGVISSRWGRQVAHGRPPISRPGDTSLNTLFSILHLLYLYRICYLLFIICFNYNNVLCYFFIFLSYRDALQQPNKYWK